MEYISRGLASEIRRKYEILKEKEDDEFYFQCEKNAKKRIIEDAQYESYQIENPNSYEENPSISKDTRKKITRNGIKNINNAMLWGIEKFNPKNFDEFFIKKIAGVLLPEMYKDPIATYRTVSARLGGKNQTRIMPSYEKVIKYEMPNFVFLLNEKLDKIENKKPIDPVDVIVASTFAHFDIARIHPFVDGNGRTARALQSIILHYYKIPVPIIKSGERYDYYNHLENAVCGYNNNKAEGKIGLSEEEQGFYEFITGKINVSLDTILEKCCN
jgi:Fic family protein